MMAAEELGIALDEVRPIIGDTERARLHRRHRRQPRHVRERHGGGRGGARRHARSCASVPRRSGRFRSTRSRGTTGTSAPLSGDKQAAIARRHRQDRGQDRRPDRRQRRHQRAGRRAEPGHACGRRRSRPGDRQGHHPALHRHPGCRQGDPSELRRGPDAGRRRAGHRLGAQRGVRLRRATAGC